jgi:hypothetical protein
MADERDKGDREQEEAGRLGGYSITFDDTAGVPFPGDIRAAAVSALWAGVVAGLTMILAAMILYGMLGLGFWFPLKLIAMPILGIRSVFGGAGAVIIGLVLHVAVSMAVAVVFAVLLVSVLGRVGPWAGATIGAAYGLLVWLLAQYVVLPATYPLIAIGFVPWVFGFAHAVYGVVLGLAPGAYKVMPDEYGNEWLDNEVRPRQS